MLISLGVVFQVICILQAVSTRGVLVRLISVSAKQVFTAVSSSNHVPNNSVIKISLWGRLTFGCMCVPARACLQAAFIIQQKEHMQLIWV